VLGPATNTDDFIPQWDGANTKTLKDGKQVSTLGAALLNAGTKTANGILLGNGTSEIAVTAAMADGQLLVGQTGAAPLPKTISSHITIAASGAATIASAVVTFAMMATAAIATTAQFLANTASKILSTDQVWAAADLVTLVDGATVTPDFATGINFTWTIGAAGRTIANATNTKNGQSGVIYLVQDGTGSRTITSWGTSYKFSGGTKPTLSAAAGAIDVLAYCVKSATEIECFFTADMS